MAVRCPCRASPADPGEGVVGLRTTERADVKFPTVGMRAGGIRSTDVKVDTDFLPVWSTEGAVGSFCPSWFAVGKLRCGASVAVVFADGVVKFTAEDAANGVT